MDFKLSYDYRDLIKEIKSDVAEFDMGLEDPLYIVRGEPEQTRNKYSKDTYIYIPIVDYYFEDEVEDLHEDDTAESLDRMTIKEVLKEMEEMNELM